MSWINGQRKHGLWRHPSYKSWCHMMSRCYDQNNAKYSRYGGRGIDVCARWHDAALFVEDMGVKPTGYSIERVDNDAGYSPGNCVWASLTRQARNRSCVKLTLELADEIRSLPRRKRGDVDGGYTQTEIAEMFSVSRETVSKVQNNAHWVR